ncbi:MAG: glycosyltransferase family 4 protein [Bacteroidota bacterium]
MKAAGEKILVVIGQWPSKTHPYLVWLFAELKKQFPQLELFLFDKPALQYGYELIGKELTDQVLKNASYRTPFTRNPASYVFTALLCILHLKHASGIIKDCRSKGLSLPQSFGQLHYFRSLLGKKYDLVHINALQTAVHFKSKAWFNAAQLLVSSRGQDLDFFPDRYDQVLKNADHVHVLGNYLKQKVEQRGLNNKITIIPPAYVGLKGNNHDRSMPPTTIHIATAARLSWTKGYRYSLRVIKKLVDQGYPVHYHIFGDGEQKEELVFTIAELNLSPYVTMHGWTNENELKQHLQKMNLYLLLSIEEGYNNSVLMAQGMGIPCIVAHAGGLAENVRDGISGKVIPAYHIDGAVDAIKELAGNNAYYREISAQAVARASELNLPAQVEEYAALYRKVLKA